MPPHQGSHLIKSVTSDWNMDKHAFASSFSADCHYLSIHQLQRQLIVTADRGHAWVYKSNAKTMREYCIKTKLWGFRTRTRKLFIWQVQIQSYNKSGKKHNIIEIYKYSQETEAKVQEYRYRQSHLLGHAVSWVDHRKRRWVLLVLVCYVRIKVHM